MEEKLLTTLAQIIAAVCAKWLYGLVRDTVRVSRLRSAIKAYQVHTITPHGQQVLTQYLLARNIALTREGRALVQNARKHGNDHTN